MQLIHGSALLLLVLVSCATAQTPAPDTQSPELTSPTADTSTAAAQQVKGTEEFSTTGGTLTVPEGWWVTEGESQVAIQDPEQEMNLWLVEVSGHDLNAAVSQAWGGAVPDFAREVDRAVEPPSSQGWDAILVVNYVTSAEESRVVQAVARRKGDRTFIALVDGAIAAAQRRGAQLNQIISSWKPGSLEEESLAGRDPKAWSPEIASELDGFIRTAMEQLNVPGLAIAILNNGEVVFEKGYGVRSPKGEPVTANTRFMIGSNSKSFTSLMIARLADLDALSWETPLRKLLPEFTLADAAVADKVLMHHSMCACTGLPRQDMEFIFQFDGFSAEDRIAELGTMAPTTGFGETFQYSNALVSAGGFAAARARYPELPLLEAYEKALKDTVLRPLGLTATTYRTNTVTKTDHAMPYGRGLDGRYSPIPLSYEGAVTSVVPAGGLWSNLKDMTKVMQMELANGKFGGEQLFEGENLLRRRVPGIKIGEKSHYGLALFVADNRGLQMYGHGGNTLGFTTLNDFYPEHGLGFVILSNGAGANTLTNAIERRTIELLFDARPEAESNLTFAVKNQAEAWANLEPKLAVPPPAAWAAPLVGDYSNEALGPLQVRKDGDGYVVDVGEWKSSTALHAEAGSKLLMLVDPPVAGLPLIPQADGSLLLDVGQQRYSFAPVQKTSSRR